MICASFSKQIVLRMVTPDLVESGDRPRSGQVRQPGALARQSPASEAGRSSKPSKETQRRERIRSTARLFTRWYQRDFIRLIKDDGQFVLQVQDSGKGIPDAKLEAAESFGLLGIRERARAICGTVTLVGKDGEGTEVVVWVPDLCVK